MTALLNVDARRREPVADEGERRAARRPGVTMETLTSQLASIERQEVAVRRGTLAVPGADRGAPLCVPYVSQQSATYASALGLSNPPSRPILVPREERRYVALHRLTASLDPQVVRAPAWPLVLYVSCHGCGVVDALLSIALLAQAGDYVAWLRMLLQFRSLDVLRPMPKLKGRSLLERSDLWEAFLEHDGLRAVCPDCFEALWPNGGWRAAEVVRRTTGSSQLYAETLLRAPGEAVLSYAPPVGAP